MDQPIAALLKDLKRLGMLDETLSLGRSWPHTDCRTLAHAGSNATPVPNFGPDHNSLGLTTCGAAGMGPRG